MGVLDSTVKNLPPAAPLTGSELVYIVQNGQDARTTTGAIFGFQPGAFALLGSNIFTGAQTINLNTVTLPTNFTDTLLKTGAANGANNRLAMYSFGATNAITFARADGTAALPTAVQSGEALGSNGAIGYGATGWALAGRASMLFKAGENWTDTAQGAFTTFMTTPLATIATVEMMRLQPSGGVSIGSGAFNAIDPGIGSLNCYNVLATLTSPGGSSGGITPLALYQEIFSTISQVYAAGGLLDIPAGSTAITQSAVAGYVRNKSGGTGTDIGNGVALFGAATAEANNTAIWGINTLLQDNSSRVIGALTGIVLSNEFDFNVMCPATTVNGISLGGNSLSQPANSNAFIVNPLGTGFSWGGGFVTEDSAAQFGFLIGSLGTSANTFGQPSIYRYRDGAGASQNIQVQAQGGFFVFSGTTGFSGLNVQSGSLFTAQGFGLTINGKSTVSSDGSNNTLLGNSTTGTKLQGNALGFYGATPVSVPSGYGTPTAVSKTASLGGTGATLAQVGGTLAALIVDLKSQGLIAA